MPTSHSRGHKIEYLDGKWRYCDTKEALDITRSCRRCGRPPTPEGYDACMGYIPGARSVCCGHGVTGAIMI